MPTKKLVHIKQSECPGIQDHIVGKYEYGAWVLSLWNRKCVTGKITMKKKKGKKKPEKEN